MKRDLKRALSEALRELRADREESMSQEALANEIGMDRSYWGDIERGERNVTLFSLYQLARGLGVTPLHLLTAIDKHYRALRQKPQREAAVARLIEFIDRSPNMMWISGPSRECVHVNRLVLEYTGRALAEIQGKGWSDDLHPEDLARHMALNQKAFAARRPYRDQYRYRKANGEYGWVAQEAVPQFSSRGVFLGFLGTLIPIDKPKR